MRGGFFGSIAGAGFAGFCKFGRRSSEAPPGKRAMFGYLMIDLLNSIKTLVPYVELGYFYRRAENLYIGLWSNRGNNQNRNLLFAARLFPLATAACPDTTESSKLPKIIGKLSPFSIA